MKILMADQLIKKIDKNHRDDILKKIREFIEQSKKINFQFQMLSCGFSVRKVKGRDDIFKFRVDAANRIIFHLEGFTAEHPTEGQVTLLDFCNHDEQIRRGYHIKKTDSSHELFLDEERDNVEINKAHKTFDLVIDGDILDDYDLNEQEYIEEENYEKILDDYILNAPINSSDIIKRIIDDKQLASIEELNQAIEYLSDEQYQCLTVEPLLLYGCAGSGKTTVTIHKLYQLYKKNDIRVGYFTFSTYLKDETKRACQRFIKLKNGLPEDEFELLKDEFEEEFKKLEFYCVNDYFSEVTYVSDYLSFDQFKKWYETPINKQLKLGLSATQMWQEIRGVLKGCIPRTEQGLLSNRFTRSQQSEYFKNNETKIMKFFEKYEQMLKITNKLDENDLAKQVLSQIQSGKINRYDYILIDEVQDLTEWQLKALTALVKNPQHLILSWDVNQSIHLHYCNPDIVKTFFYEQNLQLNQKILHKNYRSCDEIIQLANEIHQFRIRVLGKNKQFDYSEVSLKKQGVKPFKLKSSAHNLEQLLKSVEGESNIVCLVSNESQKQNLKLKYNLTHNVFTVAEFKGIEKSYVVTYNLMSDFIELWREMFLSSEIKRADREYRQCLNLFYVGVSRATQYLCLYEEKELSMFDDQFQTYFLSFDVFNKEVLHLTLNSTSEDFYKSAQLYESREFYEDAIATYKMANVEDYEARIGRCQALIYERDGQFDKAGHQFLIYQYFEEASQCFKKANNQRLLFKSLVLSKMDCLDISKVLQINPLQLKSLIQYPLEDWEHDFLVRKGGYCEMLSLELHQLNVGIGQNLNKLVKGLETL